MKILKFKTLIYLITIIFQFYLLFFNNVFGINIVLYVFILYIYIYNSNNRRDYFESGR